jgi:hypothetical protein
MMRLNTRIAMLERQQSAAPALVHQWVDMLTRLYTSIAATDAMDGGSEDGSSTFPVNPDTIKAEAERYAATGAPATISDLFRLVREVKVED